MKKLILAVAMFLPVSSNAIIPNGPLGPTVPATVLPADPTTGPQSILDLAVAKAKETKLGGTLGLDGHVGTSHYLTLYTIHDASGNNWMEFLNIGYEARKNESIHGFIMPVTVDPTFFTHRVLSGKWAQDHVTASIFPPIFIGVGPIVPMDWGLARAWKPLDITAWRVSASIRVGSLVK